MANIIKQLKTSNQIFEFISKLSTDELEQVIIYAADAYYNSSKPVISDTIYDLLIDFLKNKKPKSKVLNKIGAEVKSKNKVKLDYWLGSMDKIKPPSNQLLLWSKKYKPPYNLSDKLDGVSALLIYTNNDIKIFTRGTATEGMDISILSKYIKLPTHEHVISYCKKNKINALLSPNIIAFRGELIMKESIFNKKFSNKLKNVRNTIAGLVNSKKINIDIANSTELILYEIVDPFYSIEKQFHIIKDIGFNCVNNKIYNKELTFSMLSDYLKERRNESKYMIDGIIITSCGNHIRNIEGNPDYAFAFKDILEDQKALSKVIMVEWNISKDGYIKPTILIEPINIGGVEIQRTTGFNAKFINDNNIGPGAIVEIIRSGDVIPYITKILKPSKPQLPNKKWHWNKSKVDILIDDLDSSDLLKKNIYYFFSSLDTKGLGQKNIDKLVDGGLDSIKKILQADYERFLMIEGYAEKSAKNLVLSIKKAITNIPLYKLFAASNKFGHGMGQERMKQVLTKYPLLLDDYKKWSFDEFIDNIKQIDGWEEKTATQFVSNFKEFIKFYQTIHVLITIEQKSNLIKKGKFFNKIIVMSGFRDKKLQDEIENQGGKISSSISKNTDILIIKDKILLNEPSEKIKKALELGIQIITKEKLTFDS